MALVRFDPFRLSLSRWPDFWEEFEPASSIPVDLEETDDNVVITATVPGVTPEDLDITVTGDHVTVQYQTKKEIEKKGKKTYFAERYYGAFARTIQLPAAVDGTKAKTSFENGVLTLSLPKKEEEKPKKIKVEAK